MMEKMSVPKKGRHELIETQILIAGGVAGMANSVVRMPVDVANFHYQSAVPGTYKHIGSVCLKLVSTV